ncbi:MAG: Gfo/Idh/MocA family oxidoreductase [Chloroflexota bacterium]|nr:Gfo/Idh/MocA family oxidoreductase [Chloroflexota bacterium]
MNSVELDHVRYNFEYERKLRAAFIGAGGHSFRNVYPTFQYAPIDLVAICDRDANRAAAYARQFGAKTSYTDHQEMLTRERPDVVFIVTSYDDDGRPQATRLALDALEAGCHVWMEKPTAASTAEVRALIAARDQADRFVMSGLKKLFFPSIVKVKEIITSEEFGQPVAITVRYPQAMPPLEQRRNLVKLQGLLDHIYHPAAIIGYLMGKVSTMSYTWEAVRGGSFTNLQFVSGAIGSLHLAAGGSGSSPLERIEVIGEHANVVVDNGVNVTYYRPAQRPSYGRSASYLVDNDHAPLHWTPEFSLGQLYNKNIFYLGYVPEVLHFCDAVLGDAPPTKGTLEESLEIARLFEAYRITPPGTTIAINETADAIVG